MCECELSEAIDSLSVCGNAEEKETIIFCKALRKQKETADFFSWS